eukprot:TRINITY_DN797_c0_g2_i1.p2 TRINITY_DN797_c0_g2~~TRINITY_DN797_c0_g2_i1.p2  ORF type:complete len:262 (-),score=67.25 TRINITY_DN797_c0_g2_i1:87-872(-)
MHRNNIDSKSRSSSDTSQQSSDPTQLREARLRFFAHMNEQQEEKDKARQQSNGKSCSGGSTEKKLNREKEEDDEDEAEDTNSKRPNSVNTASNRNERRRLKNTSDDDEDETDSGSSSDSDSADESAEERLKCDECKLLKNKREFGFSFGRCRFGKHNCCALCTLNCNTRCPCCISSDFINRALGSVSKPIIKYEDEKQSDAEFMASMVKDKIIDDTSILTVYEKELQILKELDPTLEDAAAIACLEACEGDVERAALFLGL